MSGRIARLRELLFRAGALRPFQREIPIASLRHNRRHVYLQEGYGGEAIQAFPPYQFFRRYASGDTEGARRAFVDWYGEQFRKYQGVSKGKGGMHNGSLYREVLAAHERVGITLPSKQPVFRDDLVSLAIEQRVEQRLAFFVGVKERGYQPVATNPVFGIRQSDDTIELLGGHHRAAALLALGHDVLPCVTVLTPRTREVFSRLRIVP
ncbi:MAG: hypothetical protein AB7T06_07495 [Kofleriaceae bacterium]